MSDPRITPDTALVTETEPGTIIAPVTDLCRRPDGPRDRQLLLGDAVKVLGRAGDWAYVQSVKDGYCGHILKTAIGSPDTPTHRVSARATHAYPAPDFKQRETMALSFACRLIVTGTDGRFSKTQHGFIPTAHLSPIDTRDTDPAAIAALFLGTPYLWGGNSAWGIDCSGLVQAALLACGIPCPGDSDMQASLGQPATAPYQRNDLIFWKGHVALVTDPDMLIHANAHTMSTAFEPITQAITRIQAKGDGPVTAHHRL